MCATFLILFSHALMQASLSHIIIIRCWLSPDFHRAWYLTTHTHTNLQHEEPFHASNQKLKNQNQGVWGLLWHVPSPLRGGARHVDPGAVGNELPQHQQDLSSCLSRPTGSSSVPLRLNPHRHVRVPIH